MAASLFTAVCISHADGVKATPKPVPKIKIVLVGDSTVADRTGWGLGFKTLLDTNKVECINVAVGGRSSMSFMREGRWTNALALKGDYYLSSSAITISRASRAALRICPRLSPT